MKKLLISFFLFCTFLPLLKAGPDITAVGLPSCCDSLLLQLDTRDKIISSYEAQIKILSEPKPEKDIPGLVKTLALLGVLSIIIVVILITIKFNHNAST